jgi:hypothetical protein
LDYQVIDAFGFTRQTWFEPSLWTKNGNFVKGSPALLQFNMAEYQKTIDHIVDELVHLYKARKHTDTFLCGTLDLTQALPLSVLNCNNKRNRFTLRLWKLLAASTIADSDRWAIAVCKDNKSCRRLCLIRDDDPYEMEAMKQS